MIPNRSSWGSMARTCRAAIAVLLVGAIALTVPPQTKDMLEFLADDRTWDAFSFQLALVVLGGSAWFWSRAALSARLGLGESQRIVMRNDPRFDWVAFTCLPRLILVVAFLVGAVIALRGHAFRTIGGASILGAIVLVITIFRPHRDRNGPPPAPRGGFMLWISGGAWARLNALLQRAPYGRVLAIVWLALGLLPLACGLIETFVYTLQLPNRLAVLFPGPAIAVLLLGLMIGPLVATTFVFDGLTIQWRRCGLRLGLRRPPVITGILVYVFVIVPAIYDVHTVRALKSSGWTRQPLNELYDAWKQNCALPSGPVRPVIVAVSGGATRAGLWGAAVLDRVLRAQQPDGPTLFAVSSVSGGSLGTAAAMSLLSQDPLPCKATGLALLRPVHGRPVPLAGDALGPLLGGWLLTDIPRAAFEPIAAPIRRIAGRLPRGGDSAQAIEDAFARLWEEVKPPLAPDWVPWDRHFLSLFYRPSGTYRPGMPLWFANGTDAGSGNRVITTPIQAPRDKDSKDPWPFRGARDFHTLMHGDVEIATAINNTARFPYLEPFGEMIPADQNPHGKKKQVGSLIDGGYFENEGLQTALDLAEWLRHQSTAERPVRPIIIEATGDGDSHVQTSDVMTCNVASDGAFLPDTEHALQILAPLLGLYHVRGGHSAVLLRQAHDEFCDGRLRFVHFYLPADDGEPVPLNWVLSNRIAGFIGHAFQDLQVSNHTQCTRLLEALAPESGVVDPATAATACTQD
jgi:hypothetical protein